jgi:thiol reductant ABC exporter CydD subunit
VRALTRIIPSGARPPEGDLALSVSLGGAAGLLAIAQAWLVASVVSVAFLAGSGLREVAPLLAATCAAAALRAATGWGQEVSAQRYSGAVRVLVRDRLVRHRLAIGPRLASGERTGELLSTLTSGIEALDAYFAQYVPQAWLAALVPIMVLLAVLRADPLSALVLVITGSLIPVFTWLIGSSSAERARREWVTLSRLSVRFFDALAGLSTLRAFGKAEDEGAAIARASDRHRRAALGVLRLAFLSSLVLEALATLGTAVVAVEVGLRLLHARVAFRPALFVLVVVPEFYRPLRALGAAFHAGSAGREAGARIAALLSVPGPLAAPAVEAGQAATPVSSMFEAGASREKADAMRAGPPPEIRLANVRFTYPGVQRPALDTFSLTLPAGGTLALVGATGAGKTTVAHLVLRFLEPETGEIRVDGAPLAALPPEQWRQRVAWVPSRPHLFASSLRENLLVARPGARPAELERAAALAHLEAVLRELPQGWEAQVGEGGARLSGGEAQRLALARAFLKDAPVLVLDEPTAHLDAESEAAVVDAMLRLGRGRTVLLIAHRLSSLAGADRVAVLERGRLVEQGAPRDLEAANGPYARLVAAWEGSP